MVKMAGFWPFLALLILALISSWSLKNFKKNLAIWTSSLVNRAFVSLNLNFYVGVDRTVLDARSK